EQGAIHLGRLVPNRYTFEQMLAISAALDNHGSWQRLTQVHQRDHGAGIGHFRDQGANVLRHTSAAADRVEVTQASIEQTAIHAWWQTAEHQLYQSLGGGRVDVQHVV